MFNLVAEVEKKRLQAIGQTGWIECLIQREGDTAVNMAGRPYVFKRNEHGHAVCEVANSLHYAQFLKSPGNYRPYNPEAQDAAGKGAEND
jgi:hypothetical protein